MSEEKIQVLKMLEQGRINYEEALALLKALGGESVPPTAAPPAPVSPEVAVNSHSLLQELGEELREIGEEIASEVQDALQEAGSAISQGMGDGQALSGWLQGLLGNWGQYCTWQEQREIAVDSHIENLSLYISNKNGNLRLVGTDDEHISVQLHVKVQADSEEDARQLVERYLQEQQEQEEGQLQLGWQVGEEIRGSISFEIGIPRRLMAYLDLTSKNGSILIEELKAAGRAITKNGSIKVMGQAHDDWEIETKNGSITIAAEVGTLTAMSKNGSIRCVLDPIRDGTISLTTTNGSVRTEVVTGEDRGYELDLQTRSGRASADLPALAPTVEERQCFKGTTDNWEQAAIKTKVVAASRHGSVSVCSRS